MTTTVFMLDGYGFSGFMPFTKIVQSLGGTRVQVPYNNLLGNYLPGITAAAATLDTYLKKAAYASSDKIVVGISMGTQVALKWQRDYGPTSTLPTSGTGKLSFLHLASPENKFTGSVVRAGNIYGHGYGGVGLPGGGSAYDTRFFQRQYDGVADYPNATPTNPISILNAVAGMALIHTNYFTVGLDDAANQSFTDTDGAVYTWSPTYPLPWLSPFPVTPPRKTNFITNFLQGIRADKIGVWPGKLSPTNKGAAFAYLPPSQQKTPLSELDAQYRSLIEVAYDRPVTIPDP